ncbi:MAG: hypothetical protein U5K74_08820 [Gemmatimonadaceae bacterium]|nr:hypothetical protein [Gemmatimonadaceae bacterium]
MLPAARFRLHLLLVAIAALTPFVVYAVVAIAASAPAGASRRLNTDGGLPEAGPGAGQLLARVAALIDSAPAELARSSMLARPFGFGDSTTSVLAGAVSIGLLDTTGARVAMLMGSGARLDADTHQPSTSCSYRRSWHAPAVVAARLRDTVVITIPNPRSGTDSIAYQLVKALLPATARCDCLLDTHGAIVAAITDRALRNGAGGEAPSADGAALSRNGAGSTAGNAVAARTNVRWRDVALLGLLALVIGGVGTTLARRADRRARDASDWQGSQKLVVLDLNEVASSAVGAASRSFGSAIKVETLYNVAPAPVLADRKQVRSRITALITAARATLPDGGTLRLTTRFVEFGADQHGGADESLGHHIVLTVETIGDGAYHYAIYLPLSESSLTPMPELMGLDEDSKST